MMSVEEGAGEIVADAMNAYHRHFEHAFPLYEHMDKTKDDKYDISLAGARRLAKFIAECIGNNQSVPIPADYEDRVY